MAEPPLAESMRKVVFNNETYILKINKVPISGALQPGSHRPLCEEIVKEIDHYLYQFFLNKNITEIIKNNGDCIMDHQQKIYIPLIDYSLNFEPLSINMPGTNPIHPVQKSNTEDISTKSSKSLNHSENKKKKELH